MPRIMKLRRYIDHDSQMTPIDFQVTREATNKWPVTKKMEDLLLKCDVHKDEKLKMFCQDHSQLCCSDCVLLHH
ncbi:hypothetical protein DPMN_067216, partial [Dreissena polymorpha]